MTNDNNRQLCSAARGVLDRVLNAFDCSSQLLLKDLEEHLLEVQRWMPQLIGSMPYASVKLEVAAYETFARVFVVDVAEYASKSAKMTIISPSHYSELHKRYIGALESIGEMGWRLSTTQYSTEFTEGQRKRKRASALVEQKLLVSLLRSMLPTKHFEAVQALGIDAKDWHERGAGLANGAKIHREEIANRGAEFKSFFHVGKRERSGTDAVFIQDLAKLWVMGFQSKPLSWHNPTLETNSVFYVFPVSTNGTDLML